MNPANVKRRSTSKRLATLLFMTLMVGATSIAMSAEIKYEHPNLNLIVNDEPLEDVLVELGKAMKISISTPLGYNPIISCNTGNRAIADSLRLLLRDSSYSMEWASGGERLSALVIFGSASGDINAADKEGLTGNGTTRVTSSETPFSAEDSNTNNSPAGRTTITREYGEEHERSMRDIEDRRQQEREEEEIRHRERMEAEREKMEIEAKEYEAKVREEMNREADNL